MFTRQQRLLPYKAFISVRVCARVFAFFDCGRTCYVYITGTDCLRQAPAAFGLVSFLLHEGMDRIRIRKHLAVFAVAAPLFAIITYFCLSQVSSSTASRS